MQFQDTSVHSILVRFNPHLHSILKPALWIRTGSVLSAAVVSESAFYRLTSVVSVFPRRRRWHKVVHCAASAIILAAFSCASNKRLALRMTPSNVPA